MTFDDALQMLVDRSGDNGGDSGGTYVHFLPVPQPFKLSITVLTDIQIALVASTQVPAAKRAEGLKAVGRFLAGSNYHDTSIKYDLEQLVALVNALRPLKGHLDG